MGAYREALCISYFLKEVSVGGELHGQAYMVWSEKHLSKHDDIGVVEPAQSSMRFSSQRASSQLHLLAFEWQGYACLDCWVPCLAVLVTVHLP